MTDLKHDDLKNDDLKDLDFKVCPFCSQKPNIFWTVRNTYKINHFCTLGNFKSTGDVSTLQEILKIWNDLVEKRKRKMVK